MFAVISKITGGWVTVGILDPNLKGGGEVLVSVLGFRVVSFNPTASMPKSSSLSLRSVMVVYQYAQARWPHPRNVLYTIIALIELKKCYIKYYELTAQSCILNILQKLWTSSNIYTHTFTSFLNKIKQVFYIFIVLSHIPNFHELHLYISTLRTCLKRTKHNSLAILAP